MTVEQCFVGICFIPLDGNVQKFFGFSEFLAGLALMVLAWTTADVRYRFRIQTAPINLLRITFGVVAFIGVLTLLTDLWRAEQWLVPTRSPLTPASWQAILGGLFLLTFLTWAWFAFIRPPTYGRYNAKQFSDTLYRFILKGSPVELAVIADELTNSARAIVRHATDYRFVHEDDEKDPPKVEQYANDLLLLIADKRLCRAIVDSSPGTALAVFQAMADMKKYDIEVDIFAKNIFIEAIANKESFLYHEGEGYESGLIGYHKPLSQAMFSNYAMVETIGTLLDPDMYGYGKMEWDTTQYEAYCRVVLMTFNSYVKQGNRGDSPVLSSATRYIADAVSELYTLNELPSVWNTDLFHRLLIVVNFIKNAIKILDEKGVPEHVRIRVREKYGHKRETFYDHIASMIFKVIYHASAVRSPQRECWWIQHNSVWYELFNFRNLNGSASKVVKFKVRRLIYDQIVSMKLMRFPNSGSAKILGFCLNVMGFTVWNKYSKDCRALHKAVLVWTKKNFVWLHGYSTRIAEDCLVDGIVFDRTNRRLARRSLTAGLRGEPDYVYLDLDPAPPEPKPEVAAVSHPEP